MAKEDAPSILLLEDLNLYVESTSPYAPEWACLQACIDDAKDTDLFVIATTNDTRYLTVNALLCRRDAAIAIDVHCAPFWLKDNERHF